jgi:hypothetical protein
MSDSLEFILEQRKSANAAIRAALKLYPDLHYEGRHLVSHELRREDCDRIYLMPGERGDYIRLGKKVGDITVLCSKKRHYELYSQLVKLLADSRWML